MNANITWVTDAPLLLCRVTNIIISGIHNKFDFTRSLCYTEKVMMTKEEAQDLAENPAVFSAEPSDWNGVDILVTDGRPLLKLGVTADQAEAFGKALISAAKKARKEQLVFERSLR